MKFKYNLITTNKYNQDKKSTLNNYGGVPV